MYRAALLRAFELLVTSSAGARQRPPVHADQLKRAGGRRVVIFCRCRHTGRAHEQAVAQACTAAMQHTRVASLLQGAKGISAYLDADDDQTE